MKYERILCFGASPSDSFEIDRTTYKSTDFIIAVDGGITKLRKSGIKPNVFFGDCDSCLSDDKIWINESNFDVNIYPQKKEKSDFELASDFILDNWKNPLEVNIYGMMYGRTDHFLFNIEIAVKMSIHGFEVTFIGENEKLIVSNGLKPIILNVKKNKLISLFALSEKVDGVTTTNLEYPLYGETLFRKSTRGLSNVSKSKKVKITHISGILAILLIGGTE